jgi:hypothetical protein
VKRVVTPMFPFALTGPLVITVLVVLPARWAHTVTLLLEVSGMSAFGHYLLACRWRAGACPSGTIGQGPLHV